MNILLSIIGFIFALGIIVFIHELGHFMVAKIFGLYVYEFSLGFGPAIFTKKGKETKYCIRCIPIGGYVAVIGDDADAKIAEVEKDLDPSLYEGRTVKDINTLKKVLFTLAGVIMNFLFALAILSSMFLNYGQIQGETKPVITELTEGYPAKEAGFEVGDKIIKVSYNGMSCNVKTYDDFTYFITGYEVKGETEITVLRNDKEITIKVTPKYFEDQDSYLFGMTFSSSEIVDVNLLNCVPLAYSKLWGIAKATIMILIGLFKGIGLNNLGGPVAIYQVTSEAVSLGFESYLSIIVMLSLNIGLMNLIPIPALDGGRTLMYIIEGIIGKPIPKKVENVLMAISSAILFALFAFVMIKDTVGLF